MSSSDVVLLNTQNTVHKFLGGGLVADVVLWRDTSVTTGVLLSVVSVWFVFERFGYTLVSLCSSVLLLLITILFVWSKAASLLNRPAPPLPDVYLTEEMVAEVAEFTRSKLNALILVCRNVALGKDTALFLRVAACLLLIFVIGTFTDMVTLFYAGLVLSLTVPILYEKYECEIDRVVIYVYRMLRQTYLKSEEYITMLRKLDLEKIQ